MRCPQPWFLSGSLENKVTYITTPASLDLILSLSTLLSRDRIRTLKPGRERWDGDICLNVILIGLSVLLRALIKPIKIICPLYFIFHDDRETFTNYKKALEEGDLKSKSTQIQLSHARYES